MTCTTDDLVPTLVFFEPSLAIVHTFSFHRYGLRGSSTADEQYAGRGMDINYLEQIDHTKRSVYQ